MPIRSYIKPGAFDEETIALMSEAFVAAAKGLGQPSRLVLEVIAGRIIRALTSGERDPVYLLAAALAGVQREVD